MGKLLKVSQLPAALNMIDDPDQVRRLMERDDRTTAQEHYQARLDQLEESGEGSGEAIQEVTSFAVERDGDDMILRFRDLYRATGRPTKSEADTLVLASTPGRFTWLQDGGEACYQSPENRRTAIKATVILGQPREDTPEEEETGDDDGPAIPRKTVSM